MEKQIKKCIIIGSGPAAYTAAIYAGRANLNPIIIEGPVPGGQLTTTTEVENFPGYPDGISGTDLVMDLKKQAERFGTEFISGEVNSVSKLEDGNVEVYLDSGESLISNTIIISTGASAKYLGIPGEEYYLSNGGGVSACATCDGFFYSGKDVCVIGGGDTAFEEALFLSNMCRTVNLVVRGDRFKASKIIVDRVKSVSNINIYTESIPNSIDGDGMIVSGLNVTKGGLNQVIECSGVFVAIGHIPNTKFLDNLDIDLDPHGYIITKSGSTETNIEGIFACGDVADNKYRQAITAAGTGCMSAIDAERYLSHLS